jgi:hypothetical protein
MHHCGAERCARTEADQMPFGVGEGAHLDPLADLLRTVQPPATQSLGVGESNRDVGYLDVEGDAARGALTRWADPAAEPGAVGSRVAFGRRDTVVARVVRVDLSTEELVVERAQRPDVVAEDLEVHDCRSRRQNPPGP